jgi:hypothetical protein
VGTDTTVILSAFDEAIKGNFGGRVPDLWDGKTSVRIVEVFRKFLNV